MKPKKAYTMTAVGSSSFLLIFTILALVTFAALALSTAVADNRLSAKTTESTTAPQLRRQDQQRRRCHSHRAIRDRPLPRPAGQ